jgi:hypothetical protein
MERMGLCRDVETGSEIYKLTGRAAPRRDSQTPQAHDGNNSYSASTTTLDHDHDN